MTTWRKLLEYAFEDYNDSFDNVIDFVPSNKDWLDYYFDDYSKKIEGTPFTIWTKTRVYFPIIIDNVESVGSVARYPDGMANYHFGN